jgi:hypothetical protein
MNPVRVVWKLVEEKRDVLLVRPQGGKVFIRDLSHRGVVASESICERDTFRGWSGSKAKS